ncbi:MAG: Gfo/Idh/MocA family oxidoreductase [Chthoniobacterales bacterium]|nr:Gfo/Idh/MocA family oxidoreductase [Chthoniobacterales bacterium]
MAVHHRLASRLIRQPTHLMKTYRSAIIGVGVPVGGGVKGGGHQIGYMHARMYQNHPRAEIVCAADINPVNLAAFEKTFAPVAGYSDYREMLEKERPEIVSICTYVGLHRGMIEDCARAGVKGIFCEKPFLASPADLAAVLGVAEETGVKIIAAHIRRFMPMYRRVREIIASGEIGSLRLMSAGIQDWDLSEWGSHWLDMFRFWNGDAPAQWVLGQARVRDTRGYGHAMEEHAVAWFGFENGARGLVDGGMGMAPDNSMWPAVEGTDGFIRMAGEQEIVVWDRSGRRTEKDPQSPEELYNGAWGESLSSLVEWIEGGSASQIGLPNIRHTAELNLAAYSSALRGDRIDLPLTDFSAAEWPLEEIARRNPATAKQAAPGS